MIWFLAHKTTLLFARSVLESNPSPPLCTASIEWVRTNNRFGEIKIRINQQSNHSLPAPLPVRLYLFPLQSHVAYAEISNSNPTKVPRIESYFLPLQDHVLLIVKSAEDLIWQNHKSERIMEIQYQAQWSTLLEASLSESITGLLIVIRSGSSEHKGFWISLLSPPYL